MEKRKYSEKRWKVFPVTALKGGRAVDRKRISFHGGFSIEENTFLGGWIQTASY